MVKNITVWSQEYIGNIFDFKNGLNKAKEFFGSGIPIVNYVDVYSRDAIYKNTVKGRVDLTLAEINRFRVKRGDVFFTRTSETPEEVGIAAVLLEEISDCVFSGFVLRARPKKQLLLPEYCQYCFQTQQIRAEIILGCTYTTRALTNGTQLSKIQLPIPPLPEQKAIAEALSDIDHLIATTEKLIAKKKDIKKGLMQELLTGKRRVITGATEKVKASELGEIPADWNVLKISDVFRFITNNTHSRSAMNSNGGKYRNIHYGDILTKYNEIVDCASDEIPFLNADIAVRENALLHTGDVVIADTAEDEAVGKVVEILNADKFAICSGLHTVALRPQERMFAHGFLGYFMNSEIFHSSLLPYVTGIKVSSISKTTIKNAFVLCPPLNEQTIIASALRDVDKDINAQIMKLSKLQMLKSGMMSELLTGRIRLTEAKGHDEQFDDAVLISAIVNAFYTPQYPLGRKKVQKLLYLARRFQNAAPSGFLKKAAGPYKPSARYSGGEKIAQKSGYVTLTGADKGTLFAVGKNVEKAIEYAKKWDYLPAIDWLVQNFKYTKVDELEVLATVDMAICDLTAAGQEISVENIKFLIKNNAEWSPKLGKAYFSDTNIAAAINKANALFWKEA